MYRREWDGSQAKKVAFCGVLGALAIVLSALENMLPPLPMLPPGAKLGISNIVTMYAASTVGLIPAMGIALLKGLFTGVTRGLVAFLMSTSGGLLSTLVMWSLLRTRRRPFGMIGLGVCGALSHNAAQLCVAMCMTTPAVTAYIPWLVLFGIVTGTLTGLVLRLLLPILEKIKFF